MQKLINKFARVWTPAGRGADPPTLGFWRAKVIATSFGLLSIVLLPATFLPGLVLHNQLLMLAGLAVLATCIGSLSVREFARARLGLHLGQWTGWRGEAIIREPVHFWTRTMVHIAVAFVYAIVAAFLVWLILILTGT